MDKDKFVIKIYSSNTDKYPILCRVYKTGEGTKGNHAATIYQDYTTFVSILEPLMVIVYPDAMDLMPHDLKEYLDNAMIPVLHEKHDLLDSIPKRQYSDNDPEGGDDDG